MFNYRDEHDTAYEDENGILTWLAYDKFGNEIYCYQNGYTEFHVKSEPICDCGGELLYLNRGKWVCAKCGRKYNQNELDMPYVYGVDDSYPNNDIPNTKDFGRYYYAGKENAAGSVDPDSYYAYLNEMYNHPKF